MPLLDALLLDPYRMNVWIAARNDGVAGTGTHNDPYDGSTATKFDGVMNMIVTNYAGIKTCVHLGPGTFQTGGYSDTSGGWQIQPGITRAALSTSRGAKSKFLSVLCQCPVSFGEAYEST
jgi:hypothetical protein